MNNAKHMGNTPQNSSPARSKRKRGLTLAAQFTRISAKIEALYDHELDKRQGGCWVCWALPAKHTRKLDRKLDEAEDLLDAISSRELRKVSRELWNATHVWVTGRGPQERERELSQIRARQKRLIGEILR